MKWRWQLKVNAAERSFLSAELAGCGWPRVARPGRASITTATPSTAGSGVATGGGSTDPRFSYCYQANDAGYGPYYRGSDAEYYWYEDRDGDGIVFET